MIYDMRRLTNADVAPSRRDARCVLFEFRVWDHSIRFVCMHECIAKSHSFILTHLFCRPFLVWRRIENRITYDKTELAAEQNRNFFLFDNSIFRTAYVSAPIHICPVGARPRTCLATNAWGGQATHWQVQVPAYVSAVLVRIIAGARRAPRRDVQYGVCNYALASGY